MESTIALMFDFCTLTAVCTFGLGTLAKCWRGIWNRIPRCWVVPFALCEAEDIVPSCKSCDRQLEPLRVQKKCPVCKGQKGSGKCFHLSCYDHKWDTCPESAGASVRSYCGSHPFFGGFSDRKFGDSGTVPLWEEGVSSLDSGYFGMVLTAMRRGDAFEFFVLPGFRNEQDHPSYHNTM